MLTYSIAIRTLGTSGEKFLEELKSITRQTVQPERVLIYIAEDYPRPTFTIGKEEYVWVRKGMVAQRVLPYDEITSDCILILDDDVCLADDSAERLLKAMEEYKADCVGADIFQNHRMSLKSKLYAIVTNLVFPHYSNKWAFIIHANGSFSYNNRPTKDFYWSQSCGGPASLWRKKSFLHIHLEDELWLDELGFAFGDDVVESYKLHKNGLKLGMLYNSGIENLNAQSSSKAYRKSPERMYIRSKAQFIIWWRTCFNLANASLADKTVALISFIIKELWLLFVMCGVSLFCCQSSMVSSYLKGIKDGWRYVHSLEYKSIRNYIVR